jgi:hypothetical protein
MGSRVHALGQRRPARVYRRWRTVSASSPPSTRVVRQVPDDDLVLVRRVRRQRPHHGQAAALHRVHARQVQEGPADAHLGAHRVLVLRSFRQKSHSRGCCALDQPRQRDGGAHVAQRVVRRLVRQAVGGGQVLQLEDGRPSSLPAATDALGPQRPGAAHHVQQVPAAAAVLPFAGVGVDQVAPEQVARHLVVEADAVVAHADGAGRASSASMARRTGARARPAAGSAAAGCRSAGSSRGRAGSRARAGSTASPARRSRSGRHRCARRQTAPAGRAAARAEGLVVVPEEGSACRRATATTLAACCRRPGCRPTRPRSTRCWRWKPTSHAAT